MTPWFKKSFPMIVIHSVFENALKRISEYAVQRKLLWTVFSGELLWHGNDPSDSIKDGVFLD
jgi:hypothetical protein